MCPRIRKMNIANEYETLLKTGARSDLQNNERLKYIFALACYKWWSSGLLRFTRDEERSKQLNQFPKNHRLKQFFHCFCNYLTKKLEIYARGLYFEMGPCVWPLMLHAQNDAPLPRRCRVIVTPLYFL
jgi:hypothetical protein